MTTIPLTLLPEDIQSTVDEAGAKQVNIYKALAHSPELLRAWIAFAWRCAATTPPPASCVSS